jgi:phosphoribosylformylglycinamidine synthase subunit PurQ / glutaminase
MGRVKVMVLRAAGSNCDRETAHAFKMAGAAPELAHINSLIGGSRSLSGYSILAIPGGFTYGDDIASGKIMANQLRFKLKKSLLDFLCAGKLIIGICNGFQVLVKAGILPAVSGFFEKIEASLSINDSGKFEDRWVHLKRQKSVCAWTKGIKDICLLPVAHGEGKFVPESGEFLDKLRKNGQIALAYCGNDGKETGYPGNPNGSVAGVAGICDPSGRVFGLMPHPERHIFMSHHPHWTRLKKPSEPDGMAIFKNGVSAARNL